MNYNPDRVIYKVTLLGDGGVGKTSLRKRFLGDEFSNSYLATIGADFAIKRVGKDDRTVLQIWDLAGQVRFSAVREAYYLGTAGAILVYDITRPDTFYSIPNWINEVITYRNSKELLPLALVANKSDLKNDGIYPVINSQEGYQYAKELSQWAKLDVPFFETSAKTGFNVDEMFRSLVHNMDRTYRGFKL